MSRIGKLPISLPEKVTVTVSAENVVTVKGPKGELTQPVDPSIHVAIEDGSVKVSYTGDKKENEVTKQEHAFHGLYRALIHNMVVGVSEGYKAQLEIVGVGYHINDKNDNVLELVLGYTHSIYMQFPKEIKFTAVSERNKNPMLTLESCDKQLLGQVCAKIRSFRKPEPYKGKGVKFVGEEIRRKSGKSASAK